MIATTSVDNGQLMVGIADTKALKLAAFCRGILEQCVRTCSRNMRLRSESSASLLKLSSGDYCQWSGGFPLTKSQTGIMSARFLSI